MYLEKLKLDGRVAVVMGGGQGIGAACARALGEAGAVVVVADMMADRAEKTTAELRGIGLKAYAATLDVTKSKDVDAAAVVLQRLQGSRAPPDEVTRRRVGTARRARERGRTDLHRDAAHRIWHQ